MPVGRNQRGRERHQERYTSDNSYTQRRLDKVFEASSRRGLTDKMLRAGQGFLESDAVQTVMAVFQREASAMAGAWDVIQGTGEKGEGVGHRFWRELLGGTKVGNVFGLDDPSRESWDDVLEQGGVAEGNTLSQMLTGEDKDWLIDPTRREMFAMGLEVATAPSSWLTRGAPAAFKIAGRAGTAVLTKSGRNLAFRAYRSEIVKRAAAMGEDISGAALRKGNLTDETAAAFEKLERKVLRREAESMGLQGLGKQGPQIAANKITEIAERRVADRLLREGTKGLVEDQGLRIGDLRWLGLDQSGALLLKDRYLMGPGRFVARALQTGDSKLLRGKVGEVATWADTVLKRVPRNLRTNAMFRTIEKRRFITRNSAGEVMDSHLGRIYGAHQKFFLKNKEAGKLVMHYIENPEKYAKEVADKFPNHAREFEGVRRRWAALADGMGGAAVKHEFITPEQFATYQGRYISHMIDYSKIKGGMTGVDNIIKKHIDPEWSGGSIYGYGKERRAPTLDALRRALRAAGYDPDDVINYNPVEVMGQYIKTHVEAVADANFADDFVAHFSPSFHTVLNNLAPEISGMASRVSADDLLKMKNAKELMRISQDLPLFEGQYKAAIEDVAKLGPESRAAYLYEALHNVEDIEGFAKFWESHKKVIEKTSNADFSRLREYAKNKQFFVDGERVVEFRFPSTSGRLAGQTRIVPAHLLEFFQENSTKLADGIPKPVEDALKFYDLLQNSFKVTHTIFAPAFHIRNWISNTAAVAAVIGLTPILNPGRAARVAKILTGQGGDFTVKSANTGRRYTRGHLSALFNALDINPKRIQQAELVGGRETMLSKVPGLSLLETQVGKGSQLVENFARGMYFQTLLERGYSPARAAELVKEALFDYADLSWTEANILRRIIPFYTWTRKNAEFQVKNLARHPAGTATQVRLLSEQGPQSDLLPEYQRGELKVQLEAKPGRAMFLTNIDLPISNIDVLWDGGVGKTMTKWFNMVSPMLKSPQEFAMDFDSFSQRSIKGRQFIGQVGPEIARTWPKPVKEWLELEQIQARDGSIYYKANGLKMWLLFKNVLIGRMARDATRAADTVRLLGEGDTREGAMKLMRVMSGLTLQDLHLQTAHKKRLEENLRRWEDWLVDKGALAEGNYKWDPQAKKGQ